MKDRLTNFNPKIYIKRKGNNMGRQSKSYYFEPKKIIRDLVHEYINVTDFELEIIDTIAFQRLKDVRQLTCQHVYPSARHTRFEHSLGVLELTRQAIKCLNKNGFIMNKTKEKNYNIIDENLQFNVYIAALLHDVGHCPFSHLGENEFDKEKVREELYLEMAENIHLKDSELISIIKNSTKEIGAVHEQLSCIVILRIYKELLTDLSVKPKDENDTCDVCIDYELVIRCILGIEYDVSTAHKFDENGKKNILVRLINSKIFDMDKLDYIMRDSALTGIGTPAIDTKRLFRNMYLDNNYSLVFTSRAIPALQNMIDSRDGLYLYVYNHHAVVFSDFMNTYILRKLSHNSRDFLEIVYPNANRQQMNDLEEELLISSLGLVPKPYMFSVGAIIDGARSDSDWSSLLNIINVHHQDSRDYIKNSLLGEMKKDTIEYGWIKKAKSFDDEKVNRLTNKIEDTYNLIYNYKTRKFLKPWWKTVFEFSNFMNQHFRDDEIRNKIGKWICKGGEFGLEAAEMRSQIAKHVIHIIQYLYFYKKEEFNLLETLEEGEFFIIERSTRFFETEAIGELQIALKVSEIIGSPTDVNYRISDYYIKNLTNIIPQKDYSSIYAKDGFYVFSKQLKMTEIDQNKKQRHYKMIEEIFVFVATEFVNRGEQHFLKYFNNSINLDEKEKLQTESMDMMLDLFLRQNAS